MNLHVGARALQILMCTESAQHLSGTNGHFFALVEDLLVKLSDIKWTSHSLCFCGIGTFVIVPKDSKAGQ